MSMLSYINQIHPMIIYALAHTAMEVPYVSSYGQEYLTMMRGLAKDGAPPTNQGAYVVIAYIIFALATYVIVFKEVLKSNKTLTECIVWALLYAGAVYGTFNLTNMVAFKAYKHDVAMRDLLYGVVSMILLALLAYSMRTTTKA